MSASGPPVTCTLEFVLARGLEDGGPPGAAVGSWTISADGGFSASMIDGRRFSIWASDPRRSERKFGPGGEGILSPVSRQFNSGSWMNYTMVSSSISTIFFKATYSLKNCHQ